MGKITMKDDAELRRMHKKWMVKIGRRYANAEEEERRFQIFKQTVERCERHNAKKKDAGGKGEESLAICRAARRFDLFRLRWPLLEHQGTNSPCGGVGLASDLIEQEKGPRKSARSIQMVGV
uniref:Cathepsin propeptide inhibitor domain-containing protein n=1 Tax=Ananas comosus var. bracteatus TaxID=296719 RepID=A0A6V7QIP5_ANACO|nr:unnamed protein product [Ananas comosus var. bracteatus]